MAVCGHADCVQLLVDDKLAVLGNPWLHSLLQHLSPKQSNNHKTDVFKKGEKHGNTRRIHAVQQWHAAAVKGFPFSVQAFSIVVTSKENYTALKRQGRKRRRGTNRSALACFLQENLSGLVWASVAVSVQNASSSPKVSAASLKETTGSLHAPSWKGHNDLRDVETCLQTFASSSSVFHFTSQV